MQNTGPTSQESATNHKPETAFMTSLQTVFKSHNLHKNEVLKLKQAKFDRILCFENGNILLSIDTQQSESCKSGTMMMIPRSTDISLQTTTSKARVMLINCSTLAENHYCSLHLSSYTKCREGMPAAEAVIAIRPVMQLYLNSVECYLQQGIRSTMLCKIKLEEFASCIILYYSSAEIAQLFAPTIKRDDSFRRFILAHHLKAINVSDLVEMSNMCRTIFYQRFREEFGMSAKQWMLKQKIELMEKMVLDPGYRFKDIIHSLGLQSHSQFYNFCKRHFSCIPADVRMKIKQLEAADD